ncbi:MAG: lysophospholipid acyltransferase family protein [Polyangia bacterium]
MPHARAILPSPVTSPPAGRDFAAWYFLFKWLRVGLAGLAFLGFWVGATVMAFGIFPFLQLRNRHRSRFERAAACQAWLQRTFTFLHDYMRWCGLLRFNPRDVRRFLLPDGAPLAAASPLAGGGPVPRALEHLPSFDTLPSFFTLPAGGFVLVANHPTLVDVAALSGAFGRLTCIAKSSLFRSPVVGHILRACAYIDGGAGDPFSGGQVVDQGAERIRAGMPVLIFPEGSRSPVGGLHPFKRGAFEIACRTNAPVVAVTIRCTPPALGKGRPWHDIPRETARFTVTPLAVLCPSDFQGNSAAMAAACHDLYRRELNLVAEGPACLGTTVSMGA